MRIDNWPSHKPSRNWSPTLDGIRVRRIRMVPFSSDSTYDYDAYDPVKTRLSELLAEAQEPANHNASSEALRVQCSAYNSNNLVFTRS